MLNVPITPPRVPLIDERTGLIDRAWYLFFLSLNNAAQTIDNNPDVGPNADVLIASFDAAVRALAQDVGTLPIPADLSVELAKQIDAAGITDTGLLSMVAEMQKQIDALNAAPPILPSPITNGSSILYGDNLGGFSNVTIGSGVSFVGGTLSATGSGGTVTSVTGTAPVVSSGGTTPAISMAAATTSVNGYLTSTDWNTFNGKQPAGTYVTSVTGTAPVVSSGGTTPAISMAAASTSTNGYLTSTDWNTFNGKGTGTVTSVSVVSANGLAGTSSGGATPALTLSTTVTGVLKGNGTAISAAVVNTDYFAPSAPVTKTADFTVAATDVWLINNKSGSTCIATLPAAASWTGRVLRFQNYQVQTLVSASSNVVPLAGGAAGTSILLASSGDSATLVSDGSNWLMTQYVPNNILLLE